MQLQAQVSVCGAQQLQLEGQAGNAGHLLCTCPPGGLPARMHRLYSAQLSFLACGELSWLGAVASDCNPDRNA